MLEYSLMAASPRILLTTSTTSLDFVQLGLYYLKSYLSTYLPKDVHPSLTIRAFTPRRGDSGDIQTFSGMITRGRFQLVGFSCYVWNIELILKVVKDIKRRDPDTIIVLGGPEVTYRWQELMETETGVDYIVRYEGEATFLELVQHLFGNSMPLKHIKGLVYRLNGHTHANPVREPLDPKSIPSPYLSGHIRINKKRMYNLETSRGCPFNCAYCSFPLSGQKQVRYFPLERVMEEIRLLSKAGISHLEINDDNFNLNLERAKAIMREILRSRMLCYIMVFLNLSALRVDAEFIRLLKKQGNIWPAIGVQSTNPLVLKEINRVANRTFLEENLKHIRRTGLSFDLQFIIGLPNQTLGDIKADLNWAYGQNPPHITFFKLWLTRGTRLYDKILDYGYVYRLKPPHTIIRTSWMSRSEIGKAVRMTTIGRLLVAPAYRTVTRKILKDYKMTFADLCEELVKWGTFNEEKKVIRLKSYLAYKYMHKHRIKSVIGK